MTKAKPPLSPAACAVLIAAIKGPKDQGDEEDDPAK